MIGLYAGTETYHSNAHEHLHQQKYVHVHVHSDRRAPNEHHNKWRDRAATSGRDGGAKRYTEGLPRGHGGCRWEIQGLKGFDLKMQTSVSTVHGASQSGDRCRLASSVASVCAQARSNKSIDNNAASSPVKAHVAIALAGRELYFILTPTLIGTRLWRERIKIALRSLEEGGQCRVRTKLQEMSGPQKIRRWTNVPVSGPSGDVDAALDRTYASRSPTRDFRGVSLVDTFRSNVPEPAVRSNDHDGESISPSSFPILPPAHPRLASDLALRTPPTTAAGGGEWTLENVNHEITSSTISHIERFVFPSRGTSGSTSSAQSSPRASIVPSASRPASKTTTPRVDAAQNIVNDTDLVVPPAPEKRNSRQIVAVDKLHRLPSSLNCIFSVRMHA